LEQRVWSEEEDEELEEEVLKDLGMI